MATLLYRLGRFSFRRRGLVLGLWVLLLALMGVGAVTLSGPTSSAFSIPGTESSQALDVISEKMGGGGNTATARVVFTAGEGATLTQGAPKAAVEQAVAALKVAPQVANVADPYAAQTVSRDGRTAYATVTYAVAAPDLTEQAREGLLTAGRVASSAAVGVGSSRGSTTSSW